MDAGVFALVAFLSFFLGLGVGIALCGPRG
jgi:hypothetical protein